VCLWHWSTHTALNTCDNFSSRYQCSSVAVEGLNSSWVDCMIKTVGKAALMSCASVWQVAEIAVETGHWRSRTTHHKGYADRRQMWICIRNTWNYWNSEVKKIIEWFDKKVVILIHNSSIGLFPGALIMWGNEQKWWVSVTFLLVLCSISEGYVPGDHTGEYLKDRDKSHIYSIYEPF